MRPPMNARRLTVLCALAGLAGCSLSHGEPAQRHYVLGGSPGQGSAAAPRPGLAGLAVGVRRLEVAPYLESSSIAVRRGPQEITLSEFHRWGEPLSGGIGRAVAGNLTAGARFRAVDVAPWPLREKYDRLVQLHVLRFEGTASAEPAASRGEARLLVTWEIIRQRDGEVLARGTTDYRRDGWRVGDYPGLVALLDAGLGVLSDDLMASLETLGPAAA